MKADDLKFQNLRRIVLKMIALGPQNNLFANRRLRPFSFLRAGRCASYPFSRPVLFLNHEAGFIARFAFEHDPLGCRGSHP
jgi:hypothetical protein